MKKEIEGIQWGSLDAVPAGVPANMAGVATAAAQPTYPSSAKKKKNWNTIEREVLEEEKKEKTGRRGRSQLSLPKPFTRMPPKKTKRAMIKSYVSSSPCSFFYCCQY